MKGEEGVWGLAPPEAYGMNISQIKWKLLLSDESEFFFSFQASLFLIEPCYFFLSQINQETYIFLKPNQIIKWSGLKRTYNLCIVKKANLEISGSHR